ncbi:histidine--tRNA ligase [soil metagenome]
MIDEQQKAGGSRKPQILKGFRDYPPDQMRMRQEVIGRFRSVFESFGFEPLDTPAIEYLEVLTGKAGENEKLMYAFSDHGDRRVGLRYDLTVPLARFVAMHQSEIVMPFRRYHIAPVWRAEKPQRGRFREFWQCDADIVGSPSPVADAEIIAILGAALTSVGLPRFSIAVSHRQLLARIAAWAGVAEDRAGQVYRSVDKLAKIGPDSVIEELVGSGIDLVAATRVLDALSMENAHSSPLERIAENLAGDPIAQDAIGELREIFAVLPSMGVSDAQVRFDPTLARGLDYYTGPVFEAIVEEPKVGSVAGGGRYENLIGTFANRSITATGVSLGLERILEVVTEFQLIAARTSAADVLIISANSDSAAAASIASLVRAEGWRVELGLQPKRSVGEQFKFGSRKGIPIALVVGVASVAADTVRIKRLRSGEEVEVSGEAAVTQIREWLKQE